MKNWFFSHNGDVTGPLTKVEAIAFLEDKPNSYGWHPSFTQWLPSSHIGEFAGLVPLPESPAQIPQSLINEFTGKRQGLSEKLIEIDESIKFSKTYLYELEQEINIYKRLTSKMSDEVKNNISSIEGKYEGYLKTFEELVHTVNLAKSDITEVTADFNKRVAEREKDRASLPTPPPAPLVLNVGATASVIKPEIDESTSMAAVESELATSDPVGVKPVSFDPVEAMSALFDPVAAKSVSFDPVAAKPTSFDPVATKSVSFDPVAAKPTSFDPVATKPVSFDPVAAKPTSFDPVATKPVSFDPVATKPTSFDPIAVKPASFDPVAAKPTSFDPVAVKPASFDPVAIKPATFDPTMASANAAELRQGAASLDPQPVRPAANSDKGTLKFLLGSMDDLESSEPHLDIGSEPAPDELSVIEAFKADEEKKTKVSTAASQKDDTSVEESVAAKKSKSEPDVPAKLKAVTSMLKSVFRAEKNVHAEDEVSLESTVASTNSKEDTSDVQDEQLAMTEEHADGDSNEDRAGRMRRRSRRRR